MLLVQSTLTLRSAWGGPSGPREAADPSPRAQLSLRLPQARAGAAWTPRPRAEAGMWQALNTCQSTIHWLTEQMHKHVEGEWDAVAGPRAGGCAGVSGRVCLRRRAEGHTTTPPLGVGVAGSNAALCPSGRGLTQGAGGRGLTQGARQDVR